MQRMHFDYLEYTPERAVYFERLNRQWLEEYFEVEPIDEYVLTHPEEAILKEGGYIAFIAKDGQIIGTAALKRLNEDTFELTKMAVDKEHRGMGAGMLLCEHMIEYARINAAREVILYTQTQLEAAIHVYERLGFQRIPLTDNKYKRADVMMTLPLI